MNTVRNAKLWPKAVLFILILVLGVYAGVGLLPDKAIANRVSSVITPAESQEPSSSFAIDTALMENDINQIISQYPGVEVSVAIVDVNTGKKYDYGVSQSYIGASIIKLLTASLYLQQVEQGKASLSQLVNGYSAKYQLQQLIEQSDNNAWSALDEILGTNALQTWGDEIGLSSYNASTKVIGAEDMAELLAKLYQKQLLNESNTELLLGYMNNANYREFIASAVPASAEVYHKAGFLSDRIHDAAIIDDGKNPYVLVVFSKAESGAYDTKTGQEMMQAITSSTVKAFIKS